MDLSLGGLVFFVLLLLLDTLLAALCDDAATSSCACLPAVIDALYGATFAGPGIVRSAPLDTSIVLHDVYDITSSWKS